MARPLSFHDTGRQSPFRRQNSASPATVKAATPTSSPTKTPSSNWSPIKAGSLSPEKASPFVRRPSQINNAGERPASPFARPGSSLGIPQSPSASRQVSNASVNSSRGGSSEDVAVPASPFTRLGSSLDIPQSPSRQASSDSVLINRGGSSEEVAVPASPRPLPSPTRRSSPPVAIEDGDITTAATPTPSSPAIPHNTDYFSSPTPAIRQTTALFSSPSPSPFDGPALDSPFHTHGTDQASSPAMSSFATQANLRPTAHRIPTSSTVSTIRPANSNSSSNSNSNNPTSAPPPIFNPTAAPPSRPTATPTRPTATRPTPTTRSLTTSVQGSGYTHVPQPLLRSMRESFEVLDTSNAGSLNPANLSTMLEQMGMPCSAVDVKEYFPGTTAGQQQMNLARYLDVLAAPMAQLSHSDELTAAFEAFDVDDSGQIDVQELRNAILHTAPEQGVDDFERLDAQELDSILGEFASRRAFGAKGVNVAKGKGEVFRYREFMGALAGGSGDSGGGVEGAAVAA